MMVSAYMIYYKYVAESAEYEINIDYFTRNELMTQMNDINEWLKNDAVSMEDLSQMFDACIHQMFQLCRFSMSRFKQSNGFEALVRCFKIEVHKEETPILVSTPTTP